MKFSARFEYALLTLLHLKCEPDEGPVSGKALSESLKLPYRFLEQILADLKRSGLIRAARGSQGGYRLNRDPADISVYDIYVATEGQFQPWDCGAGDEKDGCGSDHNKCVISAFYGDFRSTFISLMKGYTLNTLCSAAQSLKRNQQAVTAP